MIKQNEVKKKLTQNQPVIGTFVKTADPAIVEIIGLSGFDFFVLDNEHVAMSREAMVNTMRAASAVSIVPIVRVRENQPVEVLQALDAGAFGVQVPNVDTYAEAKQLADSVKYTPEGNRGFSPSVRAAGYGFIDKNEYIKLSNENTLIVSHCETVTSVENLDQILTIPAIDVVFIGPMDLSQSYGVIGNDSHPTVVNAIETVIQKTVKAGKTAGIFVGTIEKAKHFIEMGANYIIIGSDQGMMSGVAKNYVKELKK